MSVEVELSGELGQGTFAIVDDEDALKVRAYKWYMSYVGRSGYYKVVTSDGTTLHHFIIGKPPAGQVTSHINGNSLDNRKVNLQHTSQRKNMARDLLHTKGYYWDKSRGCWQVSICVNCHRINGGRYVDEAVAAKVAKDLRRKLQGL